MSERKALITEELLTIPTYEMGEEESLPLFYKLRINQGTKGDFYPYKSNDKLTMQLNPDHQYRALRLENDYIRVTVLPELGGRIYEGYDKVNDHNFVYKNNVIKPALIGLNGAWISGGIEFNWPQHHRPSTFLPLESTICEEDDGSVTAWVGETEAMNGLKCLLGVNVHPDKSHITAKAKIYNPTNQKHSFHWWANLAVHVDDSYRLMFPPDIDYITFHNRSHVSKFPIVKNSFAGFEFYDGVDIRNYKDIDAASSYFIFDSQYSFMAGYNDNRQMGTVHVADKYISPGKKFFTWGHAGYAKQWQKNLTDEDGEYIEIMTGCYTDNQPDFTWIMPQETKTFEQRWYSFKGLDDLKNATEDGAMSVITRDNGVVVQFNVTAPHQVTLDVNGVQTAYDAVPGGAYEYYTEGIKEVDSVVATVTAEDGKVLIAWKKLPMYFDDKEVPQPRKQPLQPEEIDSVDELYANGMHIEQYKNPTLVPDPYYMEILKRDPGDLRANTAMAIMNYRRANFEGALPFLNAAVKRVTSRNPNPYDSDCYYQMGIVLRQLGENQKALPFLKRAAWQYAYKSPAYLHCAELEIMAGDYETALKDLDSSMEANYYSLRTRTLKEAILIRMGDTKEALRIAEETITWDPLASGSYFAKILCGVENAKEKLISVLGAKTSAYLDLAETYLSAGLYEEALQVLEVCPLKTALSACYEEYTKAKLSTDYVITNSMDSIPLDRIFPNRIMDFTILEYVCTNSTSTIAAYFLGCMYFARDTYQKAAAYWQLAIKRNPEFADAHRALAQVLYENYKDANAAKAELKTAFALYASPRILFEYYQLLKVTGTAPEVLIELLTEHMDITRTRQELVLQYVELLNMVGRSEEAKYFLDHGQFYTYEGGEGETPQTHAFTHIMLGKKALAEGDNQKALAEFIEAGEYPEQFHEGPRYQQADAHRYYYAAVGYKAVGDMENYEKQLKLAASQFDSLAESQFYKGLALQKLGELTKAAEIFGKLKSDGERIAKKEQIEFFLRFPASLPYEQSQPRYMTKTGNIARCLGRIGLGEIQEAKEIIEEVKKIGVPSIWLTLALSEIE